MKFNPTCQLRGEGPGTQNQRAPEDRPMRENASSTSHTAAVRFCWLLAWLIGDRTFLR
jgi:hypothetical protein